MNTAFPCRDCDKLFPKLLPLRRHLWKAHFSSNQLEAVNDCIEYAEAHVVFIKTEPVTLGDGDNTNQADGTTFVPLDVKPAIKWRNGGSVTNFGTREQPTHPGSSRAAVRERGSSMVDRDGSRDHRNRDGSRDLRDRDGDGDGPDMKEETKTPRVVTTAAELEGARLGRGDLIRLLDQPKFERLVKGCFVRLDKADAKGKIFSTVEQILRVGERGKPYQLEPGKGTTRKILHLEVAVDVRISMVSNKRIGPKEFQRWKRQRLHNSFPFPLADEMKQRDEVMKRVVVAIKKEEVEEPAPVAQRPPSPAKARSPSPSAPAKRTTARKPKPGAPTHFALGMQLQSAWFLPKRFRKQRIEVPSDCAFSDWEMLSPNAPSSPFGTNDDMEFLSEFLEFGSSMEQEVAERNASSASLGSDGWSLIDQTSTPQPPPPEQPPMHWKLAHHDHDHDGLEASTWNWNMVDGPSAPKSLSPRSPEQSPIHRQFAQSVALETPVSRRAKLPAIKLRLKKEPTGSGCWMLVKKESEWSPAAPLRRSSRKKRCRKLYVRTSGKYLEFAFPYFEEADEVDYKERDFKPAVQREEGQPRPVKTPFCRFLARSADTVKRGQRRRRVGGVSPVRKNSFFKRAWSKWDSLPEDEKSVYVAEWSRERERYRREKKAFDAKKAEIPPPSALIRPDSISLYDTTSRQ